MSIFLHREIQKSAFGEDGVRNSQKQFLNCDVYKPSELQTFLKIRGLHAKKSLSQNFLIDGNIIQKIVDTASISSGDLVIEIGPGPGALTKALLGRGAFVTAIEMDAPFAKELHRLQTPDHRLKIICNDILKFPLAGFLQKHPGKYKVVANLPYHITTPILTLLLPLYQDIESLTIMVQKEFANRMIAEKRTPEYSSFTLFLQFYASVDKSFTVSPNCFYPRPKVHSSVVHCKLHPPLIKINTDAFFLLTRSAFGKRRKMLRASLKDLYPIKKVEQALVKLGHLNTARPEELTIDEFIALFHLLNASLH
jgi:16S rRNA (adenine1518-N6/adenine1519-N6)-dimethyltransferase